MGDFILNVIKRDGKKVAFDKAKIESAVYRAMKFGSGLVDESISKKIADDCEKVYTEREEIPTVSDIENYVYKELIKYGHIETAKAYEGYRAVQEFKRNNNTTDKSILS